MARTGNGRLEGIGEISLFKIVGSRCLELLQMNGFVADLADVFNDVNVKIRCQDVAVLSKCVNNVLAAV